MFKKSLKIIFTILGLVIGYIVSEGILTLLREFKINIIKGAISTTIFYIFCISLFGIIFYFISPGLYKLISKSSFNKLFNSREWLSINLSTNSSTI